jgi:hypothetical protein
MTQIAILTKWKYVVEFEDDETKEISGTLGRADTQEECESLIEDEVQRHRSHGRTVVDIEVGEVCAEYDGEGQIPAEDDGRVIFHSCSGHHRHVTAVVIFYENTKLTCSYDCRATLPVRFRKGGKREA